MVSNQAQATKVAEIIQILSKTGQNLGISATQTTDVSGTVKFSVSLNSGILYNNFLKTNLNSIQSVFKAVDPVVQFLTTKIPLLSDFDATRSFFNRDTDTSSISLRDVLQVVAEIRYGKDDVGEKKKYDFSLIDQIVNFNKAVNSIPSLGNTYELGYVEIDSAGNLDDFLKDTSISSSLELPEEFKIPLLQKPGEFTFGLLSGSNQKIFSYELPTLTLPKIELADLKTPIKIPLPILPVVGIQVNGFVEASAQLGFGFDTTGFKSGNFQDGFYVDTKGDEFNLQIGPKFSPYLGVTGLAEVNVEGTIGGNFGFNLADGGDGEIRWNALVTS